jgi:hypothetical protein
MRGSKSSNSSLLQENTLQEIPIGEMGRHRAEWQDSDSEFIWAEMCAMGFYT